MSDARVKEGEISKGHQSNWHRDGVVGGWGGGVRVKYINIALIQNDSNITYLSIKGRNKELNYIFDSECIYKKI